MPDTVASAALCCPITSAHTRCCRYAPLLHPQLRKSLLPPLPPAAASATQHNCCLAHCRRRAVTEVGQGRGECYTINVPLPPGSGSGAYRATFDRVVAPALDLFQPELVLVSCGFDASYLDPLSAMMLSSEDFRYARLSMASPVEHAQV